MTERDHFHDGMYDGPCRPGRCSLLDFDLPDCSRCHRPILGEPVRADHHEELWCSESCRDGDAEAAADLHARLAQR